MIFAFNGGIVLDHTDTAACIKRSCDTKRTGSSWMILSFLFISETGLADKTRFIAVFIFGQLDAFLFSGFYAVKQPCHISS